MPPRLPDTYGTPNQASSRRNVRGYSTSDIARANNINAEILGDAGNDLGDIAQDRMDREEAEGKRKAMEAKSRHEAENKAAVLNAQDRENIAQRRLLDLMYGTDDQPGLYQSHGSDALNLESSFEEKWKPIKEEMLNGVDNAVAKTALETSLENMYMTTLGGVKRHRNTESTAYFASLTQEKIGLEHDRVGLDWKSNDSFDEAISNVRESARQLAVSKGMKAQPLINEQVAQLYQSRIMGMVASNDAGTILDALDLYNKARKKGDIKDFATAMAIEKLLDGVVPAGRCETCL